MSDKAACHDGQVTSRLASQHPRRRLLAHRTVPLPAAPAGEDAALPVGRAALARLSGDAQGQGKELPGYVVREFEEYLKCGRLEHGFLRVRCESCHHEKLVAFVCSSNYTSCVHAVMPMLASYK